MSFANRLKGPPPRPPPPLRRRAPSPRRRRRASLPHPSAKLRALVPESKREDAKAARVESPQDQRYQELKARVHHRLFDVLDLSKAKEMTEEKKGEEVAAATQRIVGEEGIALTKDERARLLQDIRDEVFGLGPIEPLLRDPTVCDILVNGPTRSTSSARARCSRRASASATTRTCCASSSASSRASAGASTSRTRWSTRGSPTARA